LSLSPRAAGCRAATIALALALVGCGGDGSPVPGASPTPLTRVGAVREAARITGLAQLEILQAARPGLFERDIKGLIDDVFAREGATEVAFPHIVAAGANGIDLHYSGASGKLRDGELLLVDIGAKNAGYASDLTRTLPVNGHFTPRQRALYELVLAVQQELVQGAEVGRDSLVSLQARTVELLGASPLRALDEDGQLQTMDHFYVHFIGHYIGRYVHGEDTGWSRDLPLEVEQTLAIEPGLYIADEGIAIRIEDDFVVTALGLECLSAQVPRTVAEIESVMASAKTPPGIPPARFALPVDPAGRTPPHMDFGPR